MQELLNRVKQILGVRKGKFRSRGGRYMSESTMTRPFEREGDTVATWQEKLDEAHRREATEAARVFALFG